MRGELIPAQCLEAQEHRAQGVSRRGRGAVGAWLMGDGGLVAASPTAPKLSVRREGSGSSWGEDVQGKYQAPGLSVVSSEQKAGDQ